MRMLFPFKLIIHFVYYYYLMQEGLRNTVAYDLHQTQSDCECVFLLRRAGDNNSGLQILVDFAPVCKSQQTSQSGDAQYFSTLPTYNMDHKFYTPSFVLDEDKVTLLLFRLSSKKMIHRFWSIIPAKSKSFLKRKMSW